MINTPTKLSIVDHIEDQLEISKLSVAELEAVSRVAMKVFDTTEVPRQITPRQLFILAFLKGREFTLEEMGAFDDDSDSLQMAQTFTERYM